MVGFHPLVRCHGIRKIEHRVDDGPDPTIGYQRPDVLSHRGDDLLAFGKRP